MVIILSLQNLLYQKARPKYGVQFITGNDLSEINLNVCTILKHPEQAE